MCKFTYYCSCCFGQWRGDLHRRWRVRWGVFCLVFVNTPFLSVACFFFNLIIICVRLWYSFVSRVRIVVSKMWRMLGRCHLLCIAVHRYLCVCVLLGELIVVASYTAAVARCSGWKSCADSRARRLGQPRAGLLLYLVLLLEA